MMGGLAATFIQVTTPLSIQTGGTVYSIQEILDSILPGLLQLATVGGVYLYLEKVNRNYTQIVLLMIGIGLILGGLGIL